MCPTCYSPTYCVQGVRRSFWFAAVLLLVFCSYAFFPTSALAQAAATIVGSVTDQSGAAIPHARVTVSNVDKGYYRQVVTNGVGAYTAPALPIGNYTVTAEVPGFKTEVRTGIALTVGRIQRVDFSLQVGQSTQRVTVAGNIPRVQTETAALSSVISGPQIQDLDLNGRNFTALALLVPGASPDNGLDTTDVGIYANLNMSFNGNRYEYNNWQVDGGANTDDTSGTTTNTFPSIDSIAEFRISTSNFGADMGRHAGANIQVVTKSGTQQFHGDLYDYVRNDAFDANDWFANRQIAPPGGNAPKTPLTWNDYGFTLGGPVYIPGHYNTDKSKTFFFWSEEWRHYSEGTVINQSVPSLEMRQGNFSQCDSSSPAFNAVAASGCVLPREPSTGQLYPNDTVPVSPPGLALLNAFVPLPNDGVIGYVTAPRLPTTWREDSIRIDQNISEKTRVFGRYTQDAWDTIVTPSLWTSSIYGTSETNFLGPTKSAVLNITHTFKPSLLNEFVMNFTNDYWHLQQQAGPSSPAGSIDKPSNWSVSNLFPANSSNPMLPSISVQGGNAFSFIQDAYVNAYSSQPFITGTESMMWTIGHHMLKFGIYGQHLNTYGPNRADTQGFLTFSTGSAVTTGNALADMFLGQIGQYTESTATVNGVPVGGMEYGDYRQWDFEPYIQDDWKISNKLTLNLGLRTYFFTDLRDVQHPTIDSAFEPNLYNPALEAPLNAAGLLTPNPATGQIYTNDIYGNGLVECGMHGTPTGCLHVGDKNLAPRFGFAWDPTGHGKTVIRGGYGIYYEIGNWNESMSGAIGGNPPAALTPSIFNLVGYSAIHPVPNILSQPVGPANILTLPQVWKFPSVQDFSLGIQHDFGGNNVVMVSYVGNQGRHLANQQNINQVAKNATTRVVPALAGAVAGCSAAGVCNVQQVLINDQAPNIFFVPYQGYGSIGLKEDAALSNYNALQAEYSHAFSHGLTLQVAYTWSHALDDSTSTYFTTGVDDSNLRRWYATSDINRTQVFVTNFVYNLPFFTSSGHVLARSVLGGWTLSDITSFFTGEPINFGCGINGMSSGIGEGIMCNSLGRVQINKSVIDDPQFGPTPGWINPGVIGQPALGQLAANGESGMFGYMGRNVLTGPGRNNWDIALLKDFKTPWFNGEHSTVQFRLETFNTFNHPQWKTINVSCSGATSPGAACSGSNNIGNGEVASDWGPRILQLALKFIF
jgi:hypothetical protein